MGFRDLLKKKDHHDDDNEHVAGRSAGAAGGGGRDPGGPGPTAPPPEFTFIRSDTHTHEVIHPPSDPASLHRGDDDQYLTARDNSGGGGASSLARRSLDVFKPRSRSVSDVSSTRSSNGDAAAAAVPGARRRLSQRLHLSRSPSSSSNVPQDLPEIVGGEEQQWEARATMLARENEKHRSRPASPVRDPMTAGGRFGGTGGYEYQEKMDRTTMMTTGTGTGTGGGDNGVVSSKAIDANIQEAIRLHEEGKLEESTRLFGQLADPKGANNPLSQVLYGLALRHGWGCEPDTAAAVSFLSAAASNAATVESLALQAGLKKGGAAKGELVLAIFELANCFRHGWGIPKDPIAAKQYYETAANLGDTDAMNEAAWCYLEGFGCKKDKFAAAKYYRRAEENGNKTLGNSWIWKEKYDPGKGKK